MALNNKPYVAVDLFAGGGGLTIGLKKAGFLVCAAVELDKHAAETYQANHPEVVLFERDIKKISGVELVRASPTNEITLISACPPCQGFSSLTAKYKKEDPRNELIFEFVRLVEEIRPEMIMMENVPGLAGKGMPYFSEALNKFKAMGYNISYDVVDVANYGVPQHRKRLVMLGSLQGKIKIPENTHAQYPVGKLKKWATVKDAIEHTPNPITMNNAVKNGGPERNSWHVVRNLSHDNIERLRATKSGKSRSEIPVALRPDCHKGSDVGFSNVYGRMAWNKPSPTITGGCTTLSKGRFGHPTLLRTISVREAATLQTFPKNYKFRTGYMDNACKIIGNALPPKFAAYIAKSCLNHLVRQGVSCE